MNLEVLVFLSLVVTVFVLTTTSQPPANPIAESELNSDDDDEDDEEVEDEDKVQVSKPKPKSTSTSNERSPKFEAGLSLESLARLVWSNNSAIRESALQILLHRAISDDYFGEIMLLCWNKEDADLRAKAISVVQQLSRTESNRSRLAKWGAMKMLAHTISTSNTDKTYRNAMVTLYRLVLNHTNRKVFLVKAGMLDRIIEFLTVKTHSNDLRYWSLLVIHQFTLCEHLHPILIFKGLIPILGTMTRSTFGNSNMQKYCLHSLVRLISSLKSAEAPKKLQALLDMNLVNLVGACLKNEDGELVSWAIFLIQEFVTRDVARAEFASVRSLGKILVDTITHPSSNADSFMPRVTLRTLKCLSIRNDVFQSEILKAGILKKVLPFLDSGDNEAQFWAVSLLHDLIGNNSDCHDQFFALKGLETLIKISNTASSDVCLYVSDLFIFLCGIGKNRPILLRSDILYAILNFCRAEESDLQYGGALLALNLATFSADSAIKIDDNDGVEILAECILNTSRQDLQVVAAKALSTMARKSYEVHEPIFRLVVQELVVKIKSLKYSAQNSNDLHTFLECFQIFIQPDALKPSPDPSFPRRNETFVFEDLDWSTSLEPLCAKVIDMLLFPFINDSFYVEEVFEGAVESEVPLLKADINDVLFYRVEEVAQKMRDISENSYTDEEVMDQNTRYFFAFKAMSMLMPLLQNERARVFFEKNNIAVILISLVRLNSKVLCNQAIAALGLCLQQGLSRTTLATIPEFIDTLLSHILTEESTATKFYGSLIFDHLTDYTSEELAQEVEGVAEIDIESITPYLYWSKNKMEVRNDSWTFESARCNVCVSREGKYAFEVKLMTDGIIQIGWATEDCVFDPEGGEGVGDNAQSYAYDGNRVRKWHSTFTSNNTYGEEWAAGDVITVLIDLDEQTISYLRNGNDLGVAFTDVDTALNWYPAVSLAGSQGCIFNFGGSTAMLRYKPDGYIDVASKVETPIGSLPNLSSMDIASSVEIVDYMYAVTAVDHDWTVPSFYYECRLYPSKNLETACPFQLGLFDTHGTLYVIVPARDNMACIASVACEIPWQDVMLEMLHITVQSLIDDDLTESGNTTLVAKLNSFVFKDGDVLGCGFEEASSCVFFTINGHPLNVLVRCDSTHTFFPYTRNCPKLKVNYGNVPYLWYPHIQESPISPSGFDIDLDG
ncbi:hypothetical protein HDU79_001346 [Rhizoclosmatium sp. JEL0117]|nr:hypothetical protein HDU79_001346 [Rhizoclosmatium sp. JEL0117]